MALREAAALNTLQESASWTWNLLDDLEKIGKENVSPSSSHFSYVHLSSLLETSKRKSSSLITLSPGLDRYSPERNHKSYVQAQEFSTT
jgi:hypothetical protein